MDIEKALFNIQRVQILQNKLNPNTSFLISDDYAYAWDVKLYPFFESSELHVIYEKQFEVTKQEVDVVTNFADAEWLKKNYYTFYEYEDLFLRSGKYSIKTERWNLIAIFRYMYLRGTFDQQFWQTLTENGKCPIEAFSITREFDLKELSLT